MRININQHHVLEEMLRRAGLQKALRATGGGPVDLTGWGIIVSLGTDMETHIVSFCYSEWELNDYVAPEFPATDLEQVRVYFADGVPVEGQYQVSASCKRMGDETVLAIRNWIKCETSDTPLPALDSCKMYVPPTPEGAAWDDTSFETTEVDDALIGVGA